MTMSPGSPLIKAALLELGAAWPNYIRFEDLVSAACARFEGIEIPPDEVGRLEDNLLQCCYGETVEVHSESQPFTTELSARPVGSLLARWQAGRGNFVTNR